MQDAKDAATLVTAAGAGGCTLSAFPAEPQWSPGEFTWETSLIGQRDYTRLGAAMEPRRVCLGDG